MKKAESSLRSDSVKPLAVGERYAPQERLPFPESRDGARSRPSHQRVQIVVGELVGIAVTAL